MESVVFFISRSRNKYVNQKRWVLRAVGFVCRQLNYGLCISQHLLVVSYAQCLSMLKWTGRKTFHFAVGAGTVTYLRMQDVINLWIYKISFFITAISQTSSLIGVMYTSIIFFQKKSCTFVWSILVLVLWKRKSMYVKISILVSVTKGKCACHLEPGTIVS